MDKDSIKNEGTETARNISKGGRIIIRLMIAVFIFLTLGTGISSLAVKDKEFSERENRVLAQFPRLSLSSVTDGSFMEGFESWASDQFHLRDFAVSLKTVFERLTGKREENNVYIGENGFLFGFTPELNDELLAEKSKLIKAFLKENSGKEQMFMLIPSSASVYSEYLPKNVTSAEADAALKIITNSVKCKGLAIPDVKEILLTAKEKGNQLYYRTDHHWTTDGAYEAYLYTEKKWELNESDTKYDFYTVSNDFEGTLASRSGIHGGYDTVKICIPEKSEGTYVVNYEAEQRKEVSLFNKEKLNQKDKYEIFLGGNYGKISIKTTAANGKSLLLVKDSYANCLIPMLTPHFEEVVVVDPRYMTEPLRDVTSEHSFSHILFLYSVNTFIEDKALCDVLS
ncbi:MAG: hypothetical protein IKJ27_00585 [Clostridia bacterium]|nr:hypothetical protein [Clostridia bacterium]